MGLKRADAERVAASGQHRFRRGLVAGQVGLSVVLLAGAGMLVSSFVRLSRQEPGFRSERVWAGGIGLPPAQYPDPATRGRFRRALANRIADRSRSRSCSHRGCCSALRKFFAIALRTRGWEPGPGQPAATWADTKRFARIFRTLGISLLSGRDFTEQDKVDSRLVVILSNSTAEKTFSERKSHRPSDSFRH